MSFNIALIGMPASGKSTLGVLLAKRLAMGFLDTDVCMQEDAGMTLRAYQDAHGMDAFRELECTTLAELSCEHTVIATGGSAVYCQQAMAHLQSLGQVIFLDVPLASIIERIGDLRERGVVMDQGMDLDALYSQRRELYLRYATAVIDCGNQPPYKLLGQLTAQVT